MSTESDVSLPAGTGISVIAPVLNEAPHLAAMVASVLGQDFAGEFELILALGPSSDGTDRLADELARTDSRVRVVANPTGRTPNGLNAALAVARYPVVTRIDGHAEIPSNYLRVAVETLLATGADNVGGVMAAEGRTPFERAVACAMTSRLGVGSASFHVGGKAGPAETVYLGSFRRTALDRAGGFDEEFARAQDWELNHRIRQSGGLVWFTPALQVRYRPRSRPGLLARQYYQYGSWRREVMRRHPETTRTAGALRYLAAPIAVLLLVLGSTAGLVAAFGGPGWLAVGWSAPAAYLVLVVVGGLSVGAKLGAARLLVPVVLATMHLSWGAGFLLSSRVRA